jgi:hypothetical protein
MVRRIHWVAYAVLVCLIAPATALGSPPSGVHVDPGSPAGKQYQIPITAARSEASGSGSGQSANPPAFGVGVTASPSTAPTASTPATTDPATTTASSSTTATRTHPHARRHARPHLGASATRPASGDPHPPPVATARISAETDEVGSNTWLALAGGALLVLVLGCGAGLLIRQQL